MERTAFTEKSGRIRQFVHTKSCSCVLIRPWLFRGKIVSVPVWACMAEAEFDQSALVWQFCNFEKCNQNKPCICCLHRICRTLAAMCCTHQLFNNMSSFFSLCLSVSLVSLFSLLSFLFTLFTPSLSPSLLSFYSFLAFLSVSPHMHRHAMSHAVSNA